MAVALTRSMDPAHWRPTWNRFGERMVQSVIRNFDEGGRPKPWPTRVAGRRITEPSKLQDEGMLKASIKWKGTTDRPVGGVKVGVLSGPARRYAPVVHLGARGGVIKPKRGEYLRFPLRSIKTPVRSRSKRVRRQWDWVTVRQVRTVRRPFLLIQKEDETYMLDEMVSFTDGLFTQP